MRRKSRRDALLALLFVAAFAVVTAGLAQRGGLVDLDLAVARWGDAHRPAPIARVARILNRLGQGGVLLVICAVLAGGLSVVRWWRGSGWWAAARPLLYVLAAAVLVVSSVLAVKQLTARGAPSCAELPLEQTVALTGPALCPDGYADGYPGGHAVNTIVWYGVMLALVTALLHEYGRAGPPRALRLAIRVAPPVIVIGVSTYLSFHWLTDGLAGLAIGLAIDRILCLLRGWP